MLRLQLWECKDCDLIFGIDKASAEASGLGDDCPTCPNCLCEDTVYEIGAPDGYEVPYEPPAPEEPTGEEMPF